MRSLVEVRDETRFATFLSLCAALTAQECNYHQLGRDVDITPPTAKRWLGFLRGSYQWVDLLKRLQGLPLIPAVSHYRQHSGAEVDLLIEKDGRIFPMEIKAASKIRPGDARGIKILREKLGDRVQPGLILYAGSELLRLDEQTLAVPFDLVHPVQS